MPVYVTSERCGGRTGKLGRGGVLAAAAVLIMLAPGIGASQEYKTGSMVYGVPKAEKVTAKQSDIDTVDAQARELVDQLRAGSPTAVDYAERAHGALIFPDIKTESRLLLGETNALGILYVKDATGEYKKHGYYQGRRNALGFGGAGEGSSSRIFMFMNEKALDDFLAGEVTAKYMKVDPVTGETDGDADADIAAFITNVKGDVSDPTFNGLWIAPVTLIN